MGAAEEASAAATCLKRSALLYTSGSSTFVVSENASNTSIPAAVTSCPTVTLPVTSTVYTCNATAATAASTQAVMADDG